ncbi:MAG: hypothetical protein ACI97A_004261 [Planctomycetota bacterium]
MINFELVVARYAESLKWLRKIPSDFQISVYDKQGDWPGGMPLENVGHEAHTYLHHIVERYDSLANITVFAQGRPFDHVPDFHRRIRKLVAGEEEVQAFRWMGFVVDFDDKFGDRLFRSWSKNKDRRSLDLEGFCQALWSVSATDRFVFYPGAQFIVTAEQIRRQPVTFYQRALDLSVSFPDAGHCLERCWDRVFECDGLPESFRGRELPIYLRPIRRLGITWDSIPEEDRGW